MTNNPQQAAILQGARVLIEVDGKNIGEYPLNQFLLTVGRSSDNDVRIPSQHVSRMHAKIYWEHDAWVIEDADSLNGLIYRGNRIDRLALTDRDRIHLSPKVVLCYRTTP